MKLILCGPVGSGKTTIAHRLHRQLEEHGYEILHSDDFNTDTYQRMLDRVGEEDGNWILDGTFYMKRWRERFRELGGVKVIWIRAELEDCLSRNQEREEPLEEKVVHIMWNKFEEPDADLVIDTGSLSPDEAVDKIIERLDLGTEEDARD